MTLPLSDPPACSYCAVGIFSGGVKRGDKMFCSESHERKYNALMGMPAASDAKDACKPTNPKDAIGSDKIPLHLWPNTATALGAMALLDGACKYGRSNFRAVGVRASIYFDAAQRHLCKWFEGEDVDPDSGLPHLAHVLACVAIVVDAQSAGKLNDDRMVKGGYLGLLESLAPEVPRVKANHADKDPKHYTIEDKV